MFNCPIFSPFCNALIVGEIETTPNLSFDDYNDLMADLDNTLKENEVSRDTVKSLKDQLKKWIKYATKGSTEYTEYIGKKKAELKDEKRILSKFSKSLIGFIIYSKKSRI